MGRRRVKKVLFLTGSRGEWGYIKPLIELIKNKGEIDYSICVTNMHLLPNHGNTYEEIINDGFKIDYKIHMSIDGYNYYTHLKSLAIFLTSFSDILDSSRPDCIILAGDRGEQLMGSIASGYTYIPSIHIQAGERSGNIDGMARHAIGKFSHIHIASSKDAEERLIKLGEEKFRIKKFGAPQIDDMIKHTKKLSDFKEFDNLKEKKYFLVVQHPVTEEYSESYIQMKATLNALKKYDCKKVLILPNNDTGTIEVQKAINENIDSSYLIFSNLSREMYLTLLKFSNLIIGNSSSGLLEAPTYKIPSVNIGRRQEGRERGINVIDVSLFIEFEISKAIDKAISNDFNDYLTENCFNPYGDGYSSERIYDLILNLEINDIVLTKNLTY